MFPKIIKKRSAFLEISKCGSCARTKGVVSLCFKSDVEGARVGYTASRKVGNAVKRNFAKRRLRSLVREFESEFLSGISFVFIATRKTVDLDYPGLRSDFIYSLKKSRECELARVG